MLLTDKRILVAGASSGIGKSIVDSCLQNGAKVAAFARTAESTLTDQDNLLVKNVDITNAAAVKTFFEHINTLWQGIDIVINSAGVMYYQLMENINHAEWQQTLDVNCRGFLHLLENTLPIFTQQAHGHLVNITSDAGRQAFPGLAVYSGSKAFVEFTCKAMRHELIKYNIRISNIQPGNVATPLHNKSNDKTALTLYASDNSACFIDPKRIAAAILYAISQPENIAVNEILIEPQTEPL